MTDEGIVLAVTCELGKFVGKDYVANPESRGARKWNVKVGRKKKIQKQGTNNGCHTYTGQFLRPRNYGLKCGSDRCCQTTDCAEKNDVFSVIDKTICFNCLSNLPINKELLPELQSPSKNSSQRSVRNRELQ